MYLSLCLTFFFFFPGLTALPRRPGGVQAPVPGGAAADKEREEAEAERAQTEDHGEPQALGQRARRAAQPALRGGAVAKACGP